MNFVARPSLRKHVIPKRIKPLAKPMAQPVKPQTKTKIPIDMSKMRNDLEQRHARLKKRTERPNRNKINTVNVVSNRKPNLIRQRGVLNTRIDRQKIRLSKYTDKIRELKNSGDGRLLVILACGPSVKNADLERLVGHPKIDIMTINKPNMRVWPTKYWVFCDQSQYRRNKDWFEKYGGLVINASSVKAERPNNHVIIRNLNGQGFSTDLLNGFHIGRSTTYAAMQIASWLRHDKVFIFGCDMAKVGGKLHFYGVNPDVKEDIREKRFKEEAKHYSYASTYLNDKERSRFCFCSRHNPWPFVKKFDHTDEISAVDKILDLAKTLT
jgi:hypothetical protein